MPQTPGPARARAGRAAAAPLIRAHVESCRACREAVEEILENERFLGRAAAALEPQLGEVLATLPVNDHEQDIFSIAVTRDGRRVITAGRAPSIGIIDLDHLAGKLRGNVQYWRDQLAPPQPRSTQKRDGRP